MPIISVEIRKIIDERAKCDRRWLGFLQLIWKDSLLFKSNLELGLSIILQERDIYETRYVAVECRSLKI